LWFGWFGFNAGSALGAGAGNQAAKVFVNTQFGAAMSMVTWAFLEVIFANLEDKKFELQPGTPMPAPTGIFPRYVEPEAK
jgi:ammonia channel protein AmtB